MVEPQARAKNVEVRIDSDAACSVTLLSGDRDRVLQVLSNLLDNAIRYSGQQGAVLLAARPEQDAIRFAVTDEGPGITCAAPLRL